MRLQEILSYIKRDLSQYSWSLIKLTRRLRFFNIYRHGKNVTVDEFTEAIKKECKGPRQLLGYRAMYQKIRQVHGLILRFGILSTFTNPKHCQII